MTHSANLRRMKLYVGPEHMAQLEAAAAWIDDAAQQIDQAETKLSKARRLLELVDLDNPADLEDWAAVMNDWECRHGTPMSETCEDCERKEV